MWREETKIVTAGGRHRNGIVLYKTDFDKLMRFIRIWDGHDSDCGVNGEYFEGCDSTMFNCDCGYEEAKREALK